MTNLDSILKSRDITLPTKVHLVKAMVFPVIMYGCESWTVMKAECRRIDAFELWCWRSLLRVPWTCKEIQPVHFKGDQPWVFFGRNDAKDETPMLWPPPVKSWLIGKDSDAGRDWGQEGKGMREYEMAGWHHRLDGCEFGWIPGVGDGQGGLVCCHSWGCRESDRTERLNWTELMPLSLKHILPHLRSWLQTYVLNCLHDISWMSKKCCKFVMLKTNFHPCAPKPASLLSSCSTLKIYSKFDHLSSLLFLLYKIQIPPTWSFCFSSYSPK